MKGFLRQIRIVKPIEMDAGSVVTSLVKEYAVERPRNMAIYLRNSTSGQSARISMRGRSYLFEMMESGFYVSKAAFTDKDSALFLILQLVKNTRFSGEIELRNTESGFFEVSNYLGQHESDKARNEEIVIQYLKVLASESSITL
jgi:hypothetical protein